MSQNLDYSVYQSSTEIRENTSNLIVLVQLLLTRSTWIVFEAFLHFMGMTRTFVIPNCHNWHIWWTSLPQFLGTLPFPVFFSTSTGLCATTPNLPTWPSWWPWWRVEHLVKILSSIYCFMLYLLRQTGGLHARNNDKTRNLFFLCLPTYDAVSLWYWYW